ncbi:MAG: hypothetical protein VKP72_05080 [bacterium]|jgi:hypothetical protein|nr:hypothetical protein [bacterium]
MTLTHYLQAIDSLIAREARPDLLDRLQAYRAHVERVIREEVTPAFLERTVSA